MHLFSGHVNFEFVTLCWSNVVELMLLGIHGNGHAFVLGTCGL
jgi:hypothetical protein